MSCAAVARVKAVAEPPPTTSAAVADRSRAVAAAWSGVLHGPVGAVVPVRQKMALPARVRAMTTSSPLPSSPLNTQAVAGWAKALCST